ncbi:CATRA conflict system CASPASE/TPR repeat-associated protein [Nonomuraea typhae]|uniref:CATRA conflict system CASPASE/TPR repeat-associated protein n=1 Tax=Nonomuraea typhae TaxID=2603600 RepID=A0ABW7ZCI3_9ACTN
MHLFVAADGERPAADLAYLLSVWRLCGDALGMTRAVPGLDLEPAEGATGLLAARTRAGGGVHQAVLRREHDVFCLSVMLEPDPAGGVGWTGLDRRWSEIMDTAGRPPPGVLGVARLFLARAADPATAELVRARVPADPDAPDAWPERGTAVPGGFTVWEASAPHDGRVERRLVVLAAEHRDAELSAWTWIGAGRELPRLARYLLHAAKLRYQVRVWEKGQGFRRLRQEADATIQTLMEIVSPSRQRDPSQAELVEASRELTSLQARELGLVDRSTRLREMCRTVDIAAANLAALSGEAALGGPFADDRELAEWFGRQLDDDATYLEAALLRSEQIGALLDRLVQRSRQRRQESVNLGLTGAVGAILMSLAAIQSLQYTVPLPAPVKPAVITVLGALALWVSLVVLRIVVPERRWARALVHAGSGAVAAALAWLVVSAAAGSGAGAGGTWLFAGLGFTAGALGSAALARLRR